MMSSETFPTQEQGRQADVLQMQTCFALRPVFWHMSDSQRQKKLLFLLMLYRAFKELSMAFPQSLCRRRNGEFMRGEDRQCG